MRRLKFSFLLLVMVAAALAQTESEIESDQVKRVGTHIACQCALARKTSIATCLPGSAISASRRAPRFTRCSAAAWMMRHYCQLRQ